MYLIGLQTTDSKDCDFLIATTVCGSIVFMELFEWHLNCIANKINSQLWSHFR